MEGKDEKNQIRELMFMHSQHFGMQIFHTKRNVIVHRRGDEERQDEHVKKITLVSPLFLLNVSQADRGLMWPVIHGHAERIPIHPSFAIYESANRPEDVTEDIHRATTLPALSGSQ